jgi:hypothetical protein
MWQTNPLRLVLQHVDGLLMQAQGCFGDLGDCRRHIEEAFNLAISWQAQPPPPPPSPNTMGKTYKGNTNRKRGKNKNKRGLAGFIWIFREVNKAVRWKALPLNTLWANMLCKCWTG